MFKPEVAALDTHTLDLIDRAMDALKPHGDRVGPCRRLLTRLGASIDPAEFADLVADIEYASVDVAGLLTAERFGTPGVLRS